MRFAESAGWHFSLGVYVFPSRLKGARRTIYRNMEPCFEQGYDVSPGCRPQLDQHGEITEALHFGLSSRTHTC